MLSLQRSVVASAAVALLLSGSSVIRADFHKSDWRFSKPIHAEASQTPYLRFSLDGPTFDHSLTSLGDLRIVDGQGGETAYSLHEERERITEERYNPKVFNRSVLPGKYSVMTLDLERDLPTNSLTLVTKSKNFKRRVEIAGSSEDKTWLVLKSDAYIFDFSGDQKVQLTTIKYPESRYRFLQVKVWNLREPPLELDGASISLITVITPKRLSRASTLFSRDEDGKKKATVCVLDLRYKNIPSDFLVLDTPEQNFSRPVEVQGSNDLKEWQSLVQSDFYRFRTEKYSVEKETIRYPDARFRYLKLIVYNHDDPPLKLKGLEVWGIDKDAIFKYESGRQYALFYGNARARQPEYDIERLKGYLAVDSLSRALLGEEQANPDFRPPRDERPWTETRPVLFWGVLLLLVGGLGTYIVRLMTKVKTAHE